MATVTYTFVSRCQSGGHTSLDVSLNGGAAHRFVYATDEVREPLSALTEDQRQAVALLVLKLHMAGKTRAEIASEFQEGSITVTI